MLLMGQYEYVIDKTHPRANKEGQVYLHIIIAERKLGRCLLPNEVVHHKDLNKLNNDPENLMVFATKGDHTRFHKNKCNEDMLLLNADGVYICIEHQNICVDCGREITRWGMRCLYCSKKHKQKVDRPASDELFNTLVYLNGNFTKASEMYGVSDNAIRKWCMAYDLPHKSQDYKQLNNKIM